MSQNTRDPVEWRITGFERLGFEPTAARILAYSRDKYGVFVYAPDVHIVLQQLWKQGYSEVRALSLAFALFSDDVDPPVEVVDDEAA